MQGMRRVLVLVVLVGGCAQPVRTVAREPRPAETARLPPPPPIDELLAQQWSAAGITPAPEADEGLFLRRLTLDLLGRVPTLSETKAYLAWTAPDKRTQLVDRLLASREFAEHWGDLYADLLFGREGRAAKLERKYDPATWLIQAFAEHVPYDRMAAALITAHGDVRENGAVAFVGSHL